MTSLHHMLFVLALLVATRGWTMGNVRSLDELASNLARHPRPRALPS